MQILVSPVVLLQDLKRCKSKQFAKYAADEIYRQFF